MRKALIQKLRLQYGGEIIEVSWKSVITVFIETVTDSDMIH
jgi:hypothetical protein